MDPLDSLLRPGMRLTIAFDDISLPLPQMRLPDARQQVIEQVLERAYRAGVDDIHLIAALALHRRMTAAELKRAVGPHVFDAFYPDRLYNHDAEDPLEIVTLGETDDGEPVELNRRAAESDLLDLREHQPRHDGRRPQIDRRRPGDLQVGHAPTTTSTPSVTPGRSWTPPTARSATRLPARAWSSRRRSRPSGSRRRSTTTCTPARSASSAGPSNAGPVRQQATFAATKRALDGMPAKARRALFTRMEAPYALTSVTAGAVDDVHAVTLERCADQQAVRVVGQADVVTAGLPSICPYNVNSIMNPVLVMCLALGYFFNLYKGKPLVREGGVMIFTHPVDREFHPVHHPSYIDFYEEVLTQTTDPREIERRFEKSFAEDEWYRHLYRTSFAYHGVHPLYMWYWGAHGLCSTPAR